MNELNTISDEEFIPFLRSLGVETYNKSFAWLLSHPDYTSVLGWIYDSLDENNALTAREEYRYSELEKHGEILSSEDLQSKLLHIKDEFKGVCLPGDQDALEDMTLDIEMQKEKLAVLLKQEQVIQELIRQNEASNQELNMELTKLHAAQKQVADDERSIGEDCVKLAKQVESITNEVVDIVADALNVYGSCAVDKELASRFFTYGPFESYRHTQELFKSHLDLFTSLKFDTKNNDVTSNHEVRTSVIEARNMEAKLSDAVCAYIDSKAELSGEQARLTLISNYDSEHQYSVTSREVHSSAIQLLEQEESILEQQIQNATKRFVEARTSLTVQEIAEAALADREVIYKDLTFLVNVTKDAVGVDRLLYSALRRELHTAEELLYFASHLRVYLQQESDFISDRIKTMNNICMDQELAEVNLQNSDALLKSIFSVLDGEPVSDPLLPVKLYTDMQKNIRELRDSILYDCRLKEEALDEIKKRALPLQKLVWDGCTKRPNRHNRSVSSLNHALTHEMASVDAKVHKISEAYINVKDSDVHMLRKLWQWFLADPSKMAAAMRYVSR